MRKPTTNRITCNVACHGYPAVDYSFQPDEWVYAPEKGTVTEVSLNAGPCGKRIQFKGDWTGATYYMCHFQDVGVKVGQRLSEGARMGIMGHTGLPAENGRHLHLRIMTNGTWVADPNDWMNRKILQWKALQTPQRIAKKGTATVLVATLNVRNAPTTSAPIQAKYTKGQKFNYDSYIDTNGFRWLSYISLSTGARRYVAQRTASGSEVYVSGGA